MPRPVDVEGLIDEQDYAHPEVQAALDNMSFGMLNLRLGTPYSHTSYALPQGYWRQGDPRPALADEDPAVMQIIGRCLAWRIAGRGKFPVLPIIGGVHPAPCPWCDYPKEELLKACDWATWWSRYLIEEVLLWKGKRGSYSRTTSTPGYQQPRWMEWWAMPREEREAEISAIKGLS